MYVCVCVCDDMYVDMFLLANLCVDMICSICVCLNVRLKSSQKQSWAARCVMPVSVVSGFDDNVEGVPESAISGDLNESVQVYF